MSVREHPEWDLSYFISDMDQLGSLTEQCEALKHCVFLVNEYINNEKSLLEYLSKKHDTEV